MSSMIGGPPIPASPGPCASERPGRAWPGWWAGLRVWVRVPAERVPRSAHRGSRWVRCQPPVSWMDRAGARKPDLVWPVGWTIAGRWRARLDDSCRIRRWASSLRLDGRSRGGRGLLRRRFGRFGGRLWLGKASGKDRQAFGRPFELRQPALGVGGLLYVIRREERNSPIGIGPAVGIRGAGSPLCIDVDGVRFQAVQMYATNLRHHRVGTQSVAILDCRGLILEDYPARPFGIIPVADVIGRELDGRRRRGRRIVRERAGTGRDERCEGRNDEQATDPAAPPSAVVRLVVTEHGTLPMDIDPQPQRPALLGTGTLKARTSPCTSSRQTGQGRGDNQGENSARPGRAEEGTIGREGIRKARTSQPKGSPPSPWLIEIASNAATPLAKSPICTGEVGTSGLMATTTPSSRTARVPPSDRTSITWNRDGSKGLLPSVGSANRVELASSC